MKRYLFKKGNQILSVDADNILTAKKIARELHGDVKFYTISKIYSLKA